MKLPAQRSVLRSGPPLVSGVAFVEDQVDYGEDGVEALGEFAFAGDGVGDFGVADFALGADQALGHGGGRDQEGSRDFVGFEAAQRAERERDLRLRSQRRVAASEDELEAIVGDFGVLVIGGIDGLGELVGVGRELFVEAGAAANQVDGFVAGGLDDPGSGEFGDSGGAPLVDGRGEGFLGGFLGELEIAHLADQRGHDAAPVGTVQLLYGGIGGQGHPPMVNNSGRGCRFGGGLFDTLMEAHTCNT